MSIKKLALSLVFAALALLSGYAAHAATATLTWALPTQRTDGTALPASAIGGFRVSYGLCASGQVPAGAQTQDFAGAVTTATIPGLTYGTWCFSVQTYDTANVFSAPSGTVSKVYTAPPNPPTVVTVGTIARNWNTGAGKLGAIAGNVALGVGCGTLKLTTVNGAQFWTIPRSAIKPLPPAGKTYVAQCA